MSSKRVDRSSANRGRQTPLGTVREQSSDAERSLDETVESTDLQPAVSFPDDRYFATLFNVSLDAIVLVNAQGVCLEVNPVACQLFGIQRSNFVGQSLLALGILLEGATDWQSVTQHPTGTWSVIRGDGAQVEVEYYLTENFSPHSSLMLLRDVTERNQLRRQVQQHQKYQTLFEILPVGVCITDAVGQIVEANPASEKILGIPMAEQVRRTYDASTWKIIRPDGSLMPAAEFATVRALRENQVIEGEEKGVIQPDGSIHWIRVSVAPIPLESYGVATAYIDITEHKETETALRQSNAFYKSLADAIPLALLRKDHQGRLTFLNQACLETLGKTEAEVLGSTLAEFYPPDIAVQHQADDQRVLATGNLLNFVQESPVTSNDTPHYTQVIKAPVRDADGTIIGIQEIHWDITDRIMLETAVRESEAKLKTLLETIPDLLIQSSRDGRFLEVYRSSGVHLINPEKIRPGSMVLDVLPTPMAIERLFYIERALDTNCLQVYEYQFLLDSATYFEEARIMPMGDDTVLVLVRDITERKLAELALRQREQEFRTLAEHSPNGILRIDRQFRVRYVNPFVTQQTGVPASTFIGQPLIESGYSEESVEAWQQAIAQTFETGEIQELETEESSQTGMQILLSQIVPERSSTGVVESVLIVSRDITALKHAQNESLHQSERERLLSTVTQQVRNSLDLTTILNAAVDQIRYLLNADRALVYRFNADGSGDMIAESVVPPWIAVLGSTLTDPCFTGELVAAYQQGKIHQFADLHTYPGELCYAELLSTFQIRANLVIPILDGKTLWGLFCIHHCAAPHFWQSWEVEMLQRLVDQLAIAIQQSELYQQVRQLNITLEQQVQERTADLQQALEFEQLLKRITDQVRDSLDETEILATVVRELAEGLSLEICDTGMYNADHTTSTIVHEYIKAPHDAAKGTTFAIADATNADVYPMLLTGQTIQFANCNISMVRTTQLYATVLACPIWDGQSILGDLWLFRGESKTFSDLEVRLVQQVANHCAIAIRQSRLYQAAENQVVELERLNHLKDDFLSTVSHELRTPMSNIKMATELLEIYLTQQRILPANFSSSPRSNTASPIERYFQILKDEGKREINLINDLLDLARIDAQTEPLMLTTIDLTTWIPHQTESFVTRTQQQQQTLILRVPHALPLFTTDTSHLQRILHELLNNACKYTPPGETIRISARAIAAQNIMELKIANSGVTLSAAECDRIFDRFYRIPNNDPWKHGGTGLGLALVKKLVEFMRGTIWAESKARSLQFVLRLPLHLDRE